MELLWEGKKGGRERSKKEEMRKGEENGKEEEKKVGKKHSDM